MCPSLTSALSKTVLNVASQTLTAEVLRHRPFQKKYFSFSLGDSARAWTTIAGSGIQTGVPVFWVYKKSLVQFRRDRSRIDASEIRRPEYRSSKIIARTRLRLPAPKFPLVVNVSAALSILSISLSSKGNVGELSERGGFTARAGFAEIHPEC